MRRSQSRLEVTFARRIRWAASFFVLMVAMSAAPVPAQTADVPRPAGASGLAAEADRLFAEHRESQMRPGIPLEPLRLRLQGLGGRLEAAGLDTLASRAFELAAWTAFRTGHMDDAFRDVQRAIDIARRGGITSLEISATNTLATCNAATGRIDEAVRVWAGLIPMSRANGDLAYAARSWANIATAYNLAVQLPEALEASDSALVCMNQANVVDGKAGLAIVRSQLLRSGGRPLESLAWADSALREARAARAVGAIGAAMGLRADGLDAVGRTEEAEVARDESVAWSEGTGDVGAIIPGRLSRARRFLRASEWDSLRSELDRLGDIAERLHDPGVQGTVAALEGWLEFRRGDTTSAVGRLRDALARLREANAAGGAARAGLRGSFALDAEPEVRAALARVLAEQGHAEEAFDLVETGRATALNARIGAPAASDSLRAGAGRVLGEHHAALVLWSESRFFPVTAFVLSGSGLATADANRPASSEPVATALQLMASGAPAAECRPALDRLSEAVLSGWLERIPAGTTRLFLVQPSWLSGFPLGALPLPGEPNVALGERYAISYLPSTATLLRLLDRPAPGAGMLVVADPRPVADASVAAPPVTTTFRRLLATPLPAARDEARAIQVPGATLLMGEQATHDSVLACAREPRAVVHFATHAVSNALRPQDSFLMLADADHLLTAGEIERLSLEADLVTLSGCGTGGGYTVVGEGTFGMPRSFLAAGARTVVTTLWDVEDRAAKTFVTAFYDGLRRGLSRDESLRDARRKLLRSGHPPRDAEAFVLVGVGHEPVPLLAGAPRGPNRLLWALPAIVLVVVLWILSRRARGRSSPSAQ